MVVGGLQEVTSTILDITYLKSGQFIYQNGISTACLDYVKFNLLLLGCLRANSSLETIKSYFGSKHSVTFAFVMNYFSIFQALLVKR